MASSSDVIPSDLPVVGTKIPEIRKAFNLLKTHASVVANFTLQWQDLEDHCNCIQKSIQKKLEIVQQKSDGEGNALLSNIGCPEFSPETHPSPPLESQVGQEETNAPSIDKPTQSKLENSHGEGDGLSSKIDGPAFSPETPRSPEVESEDDPEEIDMPHTLVSQGDCDETDSVPRDESNVKQEEVHTISIQKQDVKSDENRVQSKEHHGEEESNSAGQTVFDRIPMQDGKALLIYLVENSKLHESMRTSICNALKASADPVKLVLEAIKWFFPVDKKDMNFEDRNVKRSCVLLLEEMENAGPGIKPQEIEEARVLALDWKVKIQTGVENSLQISGFLHLLSAFGLATNFDADEIFKLCYICLQRRQAPQLLRSLGLTHRASEFIKQLISQKKQTEAVRFIYEFDLVKEFPPVPLLKTYYEYAKKATKDVKRGQASQRDLDQARGKEIVALKAIVACIERYNLEMEYPPNDLKNQIEQLKKLKNETNAKASNMGPKNELRQNGKKRPSTSSSIDLYNKRRNNHHLSFSYEESARNATVYDAPTVYSNQPFYRQPIGFLPDRDQVLISSARNSVPTSNSYFASNRVAHLHSSSSVSDHAALDFTTSTLQMISSPGTYMSPTSATWNMSLTGRYYGSSGPVSQHVGSSARSYQLAGADNTAHNSQSVVGPYGVNITLNGSSGVTFKNGFASNVTNTYSSIPEEPSRIRNYNAGAAYRSGYGGPSKPSTSIYHL